MRPKPIGLSALPASYDAPEIPKLGPPMPGDLGSTILETERSYGIEADYQAEFENDFRPNPVSEAERARRLKEAALAEEAARAPLFFRLEDRAPMPVKASSPDVAATLTSELLALTRTPQSQLKASEGPGDLNLQDRKSAFAGTSRTDTRNPNRIEDPVSPFQLMAGALIPASLITGINSDLPGTVIAQVTEANETLKTRIKEAWCYLIYPIQETAQANVEWTTAKVPAQDGLLSRASKKLVSDEGLLPELGPARLDRELQKYIWNGKGHLGLKDLWEYLNRYIYLPRIKNRQVLINTVKAAITGMLPGPFAYAERWDEATQKYLGLAISTAHSAQVVIDSDSVIVKPEVAESHRPKTEGEQPTSGGALPDMPIAPPNGGGSTKPAEEKLPTRFLGTVMISADRPAKEIHQIVEAIVEQLTTLPGSEVTLKLEIDAEVPSGLDRSKVRTLIENATTLNFIDKKVE